GAQALVLLSKVLALFDGRLQASVEDVRAAAPVCLRHRLVLGYEALPAGVTPDDAGAAVLDAVAAPRPPVPGAACARPTPRHGSRRARPGPTCCRRRCWPGSCSSGWPTATACRAATPARTGRAGSASRSTSPTSASTCRATTPAASTSTPPAGSGGCW